MGSVRLLAPILHAIGYAVFYAWCLLMGLALSALSLLRLGRLAGLPPSKR